MRLAAISVFFATFALTAWVIGSPTRAEPTFYPVGPQLQSPPEPDLPPKPVGPDLPPEPLDAEDLASLNACANNPDCPGECRALAFRRLFTHYLRPPVNTARVSAVLRDPRWLAEAEILRLKGLVIMCVFPDGLDERKYPVFWIRLIRGPHGPEVWWIVRVSGLLDPTADDFRVFLRGDASPLRIEESGWALGNGLVAHYTSKRGPFYGR
jgi:hypothetical protein